MTTRYSRNALELTRLRKLYNNAYIQKKARLRIQGFLLLVFYFPAEINYVSRPCCFYVLVFLSQRFKQPYGVYANGQKKAGARNQHTKGGPLKDSGLPASVLPGGS